MWKILWKSTQNWENSDLDLANFTKSIIESENVDEDKWSMSEHNCDNNDPSFEHLTDEQVLSGALGTIPESKEEEYDEPQCAVKQVSHEAALRHINGLIQYLEQHNDITVYDKISLKKFQLQLEKSIFK